MLGRRTIRTTHHIAYTTISGCCSACKFKSANEERYFIKWTSFSSYFVDINHIYAFWTPIYKSRAFWTLRQLQNMLWIFLFLTNIICNCWLLKKSEFTCVHYTPFDYSFLSELSGPKIISYLHFFLLFTQLTVKQMKLLLWIKMKKIMWGLWQ